MPGPRRVSVAQLEELVAWMESHPLQARATQINNPQAKQSWHRLWEELTSRLNAVGDGVTKTAKEWRQYWSDQKYKMKKRGREQHGSGTGGGLSWNGMLTPIEDRILSIMGVQNVVGNKDVRINVDAFDDSSSQLVPLLEQLHSWPVTPDPTRSTSSHPSTSGHSTPDVVKRENATPPPHTQPSPCTASQAHPPKRKHETVADADADESPERSRPHSTWALDLETRRIREEEIRWELQERRLAMEKRRVVMDERRLAMEERRLAMEERRLVMDERRLAMDEQRLF